MPLISALGRQSQADLCEFKASVIYRVNFRTGKDIQRKPVSKNQKEKKIKVNEKKVT